MLRAMMGIRALPTLSYLLDLQSGHCVAQSRGCAGADRSSISSFHLADLGRAEASRARGEHAGDGWVDEA
jgi:hypothetical protein